MSEKIVLVNVDRGTWCLTQYDCNTLQLEVGREPLLLYSYILGLWFLSPDFFQLQKSGTVPGVGLVHAPISLLPVPFAESYWKQACEVAPIFNELVDHVSLDSEFLQESLSRFKALNFYLCKYILFQLRNHLVYRHPKGYIYVNNVVYHDA